MFELRRKEYLWGPLDPGIQKTCALLLTCLWKLFIVFIALPVDLGLLHPGAYSHQHLLAKVRSAALHFILRGVVEGDNSCAAEGCRGAGGGRMEETVELIFHPHKSKGYSSYQSILYYLLSFTSLLAQRTTECKKNFVLCIIAQQHHSWLKGLKRHRVVYMHMPRYMPSVYFIWNRYLVCLLYATSPTSAICPINLLGYVFVFCLPAYCFTI